MGNEPEEKLVFCGRAETSRLSIVSSPQVVLLCQVWVLNVKCHPDRSAEARMVTRYSSFQNLTDSDDDDLKKAEAESDGINRKDRLFRPGASVGQGDEEEEEEDWEAEINQLNGPYEPEDLVTKNVHVKVPFHVPDHKVWEVKYIPAVHHVPPVRFAQMPEAAIEGDQFEDAEE